jgi:ankyrin repeat protein/uncharacterized glyoxalase superfamily protein PhnB
MSNSQLPERASLEYLKKLAKERLRELRLTDPKAKLAAAQLSIARDHGFPSWRALKAEVAGRMRGNLAPFFEACAAGDVAVLESLLAADPGLAQSADPAASHGGWTGLHTAARQGHLDAVRLLLRHGADPNAREAGDNTYPLHWAAANKNAEVILALLDAGGDPHGADDDHELDVIGWATYFYEPGRERGERPEVASLLVERGARHHIFSALSLGDPGVVRALVEQNPEALGRRMSRFEQKLTPLHFAISLKRLDLLDLLIELGADLEAKDGNGLTALEAAMLGGDREAAGRLRSAGAREPARILPSGVRPPGVRRSGALPDMSGLADSTGKCIPMVYVPDVAAALDWYVSIGFKETARYGDDGLVNFGMVSFGKAEIMFNVRAGRGERDVSLWFYTDEVDGLYQILKARQLEAARTGAKGGDPRIDFVEHINDTFYGARQFGVRDPNGYILYFIQLLEG